jgi:hypothetical protein
VTWETIVEGALQGFSDFVNSFVDIIGGSLNPTAIEGITALTAIGFIIRLVDVAPKIPRKILDEIERRRDDDDDFEYIKVRRQRK